jgi:type VI protein secretion system component VasF
LDDPALGSPVSGQLPLHQRPRRALMVETIAVGLVALAVTVYLFIALLFPERF